MKEKRNAEETGRKRKTRSKAKKQPGRVIKRTGRVKAKRNQKENREEESRYKDNR